MQQKDPAKKKCLTEEKKTLKYRANNKKTKHTTASA